MFSEIPASKYLTEGMIFVKNSEGKYATTNVSEVIATAGAQGFNTLQAAIDFAGPGDGYVTLLQSIEEDVTIADTFDISIDLNGNALTAASGDAITVYGQLVLLNGTVNAASGKAAIVVEVGGTVELAIDDKPLTINGDIVNKGLLNVVSGTIEGNISNVSGAQAELKGGVFNGEVTADETSAVLAIGGEYAKLPEASLGTGKALFGTSDRTYYVSDETNTVATLVDEGKTISFESVQESVDYSNSATTINVLEDVAEDINIESGKSVTLVLGGNTIANGNNSRGRTVVFTNPSVQGTIINHGDLEIAGTGTIDNVNHGEAAIVNFGNMIIDGAIEITRSAEAGTSAGANGNSFYVIYNQGSLEIRNANVHANGSFSSLVINGGYVEEGHALLKISGGTFAGGLNTIKNDDNGEAIITGGTFTNVAQHVILNANALEISGGTFAASGDAISCVYNVAYPEMATDANGTLKVSGGTFTGFAIQAKSGDVTVEGSFIGGINNLDGAAQVTVNVTDFEKVIYRTTDAADNENVQIVGDLAALDPATVILVGGKSRTNFSGFTIHSNRAVIHETDAMGDLWRIASAEDYRDVCALALTNYSTNLLANALYTAGGIADVTELRDMGIARLDAIVADAEADKCARMDQIVALFIAEMDDVQTAIKYTNALAQAKSNAVMEISLYANASGIEITSEVNGIIVAINGIGNDGRLAEVASLKAQAIAAIDSAVGALNARKADALNAIATAASTDVAVPTSVISAIKGAKSIDDVAILETNAIAEIEAIRSLLADIATIVANGQTLADKIDDVADAINDTDATGGLAALRTELLGEITTLQNSVANCATSTQLSTVQAAINNKIDQAVQTLTGLINGVASKVDDVSETLATLGANVNAINQEVLALKTALATGRIDGADSYLVTIRNDLMAAIAAVGAKAQDIYSKVEFVATADDVNNLSAAIAALDARTLTIDQMNGALQNVQNAIIASIASVQTSLTGIATRMDTLANGTDVQRIIASINNLNNNRLTVDDIHAALDSTLQDISDTLAVVSRNVRAIATNIGRLATAESVAALQQSVNNLETVSVEEMEAALARVQTALTGVMNDSLTSLTSQLATLTGKVAQLGNELAADIADIQAVIGSTGSDVGGVQESLNNLATKINILTQKVDNLSIVQSAKDDSVKDLNKIINNLVAKDLYSAVKPVLALTTPVVTRAASTNNNAMDSRTLYYKLVDKYSDEHAKLIVGYYEEALASIENATTVAETTTIVQAFKTKVATLDAVATIDTTVDLTAVYTLVAVAIVVSLVAVILAAILLGRKNKVAPVTTVVNVSTLPEAADETTAVASEEVAEEATEEPAEEATEEPAEEASEEPADDAATEVEDAEEDDAEEDEEDNAETDDDSDAETVSTETAEGDDTFAFSTRKPSKPFSQRLAETSEENLQVYSTLKNALCGYKKVKGRMSKKCESFRLGRELVAKIAIVGKSVRMYIALDPTVYDESKFHHKDVSEKKTYALVPMMVRVKGPRATKRALTLIDDCLSGKNKDAKYIPVDYAAQIKEAAQATDNKAE